MTRRVPALLLTVVAFAAIVITARVTPTTEVPVFASVHGEWMPSAPPAGGLTQTWFCPGVPATGEDGVGGELVVANAGSTEISAAVTLLNDEQATVSQDIPVAPHIKANSIVAIDGDEQPPTGGDGVVKYSSAHVDYVESEFIARSFHSCLNQPATIEEVRRILLGHLAGTGMGAGP